MIIILNGSLNSGKTTVAKLLQKKVPQSAHIEVDSLRKFIYWMEGLDAFPLSIENAISVTKNFCQKGLTVIIAYPFSEKQLRETVKKLEILKTPIYVFTLNPKKSIVLSNRGNRILSDREKKRIDYHYSVGINKPQIGEIIDNSAQKPEETTEIIYSKIKSDLKTEANFKKRFRS